MIKLHALIVAGLLSGCVFTGKPSFPKAEYASPVVEGRQISVRDTKGNYAALTLEADWVVSGGRHCVRGGEVALVTPAGRMVLERASACVTLKPFSFVGEAEVPFPGLGYLEAAGVSGNSPRAKIALGQGRAIGEVRIAGEAMKLNPNQFYLSVDYYSGLSASIGKVSLSTPAAGARLVVAPQEPMIYVAGSLSGLIDDAGLGFSADGRLPFAPRGALYDGSRWRKLRFDGHILAHGTMPLHPYPLSVNGRLLLDVDADDDGKTVFDGDQNDLAIAADGTLSVGYDKAGFALSVEVGQASVAYDGSRQTASFEGKLGGPLFAGTPLSFLDSASSNRVRIRGRYQSPQNFELSAKYRSTTLKGFSVSDLELRLGARGIVAKGRATLLNMGQVDVEGGIDSRGQFRLRGRADLTVAGFRMLNAEVTLENRGVQIAGTVRLPGLGEARVAGRVSADGSFSLTGRGNLAPAGLRLANASVGITQNGASISGGVQFIGNRFHVSGRANARGEFSFQGKIRLNAVVLRGSVSLGISNRGASAAVNGKACLGPACVDLPGLRVNTRGQICPTFPVLGEKCIKVF